MMAGGLEGEVAIATGAGVNTGVRFLCGDECRFMSGAMLHANGAAYVTIG